MCCHSTALFYSSPTPSVALLPFRGRAPERFPLGQPRSLSAKTHVPQTPGVFVFPLRYHAALPPQDTLCGLELEGVSSFLRNFRDGGAPSPPPSPTREDIIAASSWYSRGGLLRRRGVGMEGEGEGASVEAATAAAAGGGEAAGGTAVTRKCSSIRLLRETRDVKLTRTMLNSLQQDFAVQVLHFCLFLKSCKARAVIARVFGSQYIS